ncbi:acyltransferase [Sphingomonas sp. R647]|uniref:acyltransferase family protein n=1 Tax=Sphingomonas sp. R647 TaxID=2875233 RepID=UPI001CD757B2|nr:acyltransferase [Sphingomonas sp. R647]MCA1200169.1 acyltransferase [Sphingomonas sp. R647]
MGQSRPRDPSVDSFRGLMILLVMVGHLSVVPMDADAFKWLLSGFRMPVFMALSGYLLNIESLRSRLFGSNVKFYALRMVIPWLFATAFFTAALKRSNALHSLENVVLYPLYHLWFVPSLIICLLISFFVKVRATSLLFSSVAMFLLSVSMFGLYDLHPFKNADFEQLSHMIGDQRFYTMPMFFFMGAALASMKSQVSTFLLKVASLGASIGACLWMSAFFTRDAASGIAGYILLNSGLIFVLFRGLSLARVSIPILEAIGRQSLFFYLWHPAIFFASKETLYKVSPASLAMLATMIATVYALFLALRWLPPTGWIATIVGIAPDNRVPLAKTSEERLRFVST